MQWWRRQSAHPKCAICVCRCDNPAFAPIFPQKATGIVSAQVMTKNKGSCMKKIIWLAGVVLGLAQTSNATTISNSAADSGGSLHSWASSRTLAVSTSTSSTTTPTSKAQTQTANINAATRTLSSLVSGVASRRNIPTVATGRNFAPAPIIRKPLHRPVKTPTQPTSSPGSPRATVPDSAATAGLFGMALLGSVLMKRKLAS
jgi:hypothetical protein